jgi:hypothetical protein
MISKLTTQTVKYNKIASNEGKIGRSFKHFNDTEWLTNENVRKRHAINKPGS